MLRLQSLSRWTGSSGIRSSLSHRCTAISFSRSSVLSSPISMKMATEAPPEAAQAAPAKDAPTAIVKRGPTPRRSRIRFPPEAIAKRLYGWKMLQTWNFWSRYYREQLRTEFDEKMRFTSEKDEKKRQKKEKSVRESMLKRAAYQKIESRLAEERERIAVLSAEVAAIKAEVKQLSKREWLMALNEEVSKWNKLPEEMKNHRLVPQKKTVYYDGMN